MGKRQITVAEFADELLDRLDKHKTVDCCREELMNLADLIKQKIPEEKITVNWQEQRRELEIMNYEYSHREMGS